MAAQWRSVRVFISSTFRDMHAERDWLVKVVFPELRERLLPHRVHFVDVDLRWGVTKEQADNDRVLDLCLRQIDQCRPYFVGILGQRYGWVPDRFPADAILNYGWVQHHTGKSVTELEILYGVLTNPAMRGSAFFYLRDPTYLPDVPEPIRSVVYADDNPAAKAKLDDLKNRIRASGFPVFDRYPARWDASAYDRPNRTNGRLIGLEAFGERVRDQLWDGIRTRLGLRDAPAADGAADPLADDADDHERFMETRLRVYVGRADVGSALMGFAEGEEPVPCLLTGPSGAGKSAALARFVADYRARHPDALVVPHFVGAGPRSTNLRDTLRRLCLTLGGHFGFNPDLPDDAHALAVNFRELIARVPPAARVLLVVDAVNQFDEEDQPHELYWLPWTPPRHVRVVASCIAGPRADGGAGEAGAVLRAFGRHAHRPLVIGPLADADRREIVGRVPSLSAKALDDGQVDLLLSNSATANPLFLLVALEELRGFGSFEGLNDRIASFPQDGDTVAALFDQVVERLEEEFGPGLVRSILTLLASARRGLSEAELRELVSDNGGGGLAGVDLFAVLRQLRPYLLSRGAILSFFHSDLLRAVRERYLDAASVRRATHSRLARYFDGHSLNIGGNDWVNYRKVEELPWQWAQAEAWAPLYELLKDLRFLTAAWFTSAFDVRGYWAKVERLSPFRVLDAYDAVRARPGAYIPIVVSVVADLLDDTGLPAESLALQRFLADHHRRAGDLARVAAALCQQSVLLRRLGRPGDAAEVLYEAGEIHRATDDQKGLQLTLSNHALIAMQQHRWSTADALLTEAEQICRALDIRSALGTVLINRATLALHRGDAGLADSLYRQAEQLHRETGNREGIARAAGLDAKLRRSRGDDSGATASYDRMERDCRALGDKLGVALALEGRAVIALARRQPDKAEPQLAEAEQIFRELGNTVELATCFANRGHSHIAQGQIDAGLALLVEASTLSRATGNHHGQATFLLDIAKLLAMQGHREQARLRIEEAAMLVRGMTQADDPALCREVDRLWSMLRS